MKRNLFFSAKNVITYITFAVMSFASTNAMAEEVTYPTLSVGSQELYLEESDANYDSSNWYYTFTPAADTTYTFESYDDGYASITILDADGNTIGSAGVGDNNGNFKLTVKLNAGTKYTVKFYSAWYFCYFSLSVIAVCEHNNVTYVAAKSGVSCKEPGNVEYYLCNGCNRMFTDEKCTSEITSVSVGKFQHDFGADGICKVCGSNECKIDYLGFTAVNEDVTLTLNFPLPISRLDTNDDGKFEASFYGSYRRSVKKPSFDDYTFEYSLDKLNWTAKTAKWMYNNDEQVVSSLYYDQNDMPNVVFVSSPTDNTQQTIVTIPAGKTLYIRHTGNDITNMSYASSWGWRFTASGQVKITGNVMSLLSNDLTATSVGSGAFYDALCGEVEIVASATSPDEGAYDGMASTGTVYLPQSIIAEGTSGISSSLTVKPIKEASLSDDMTSSEIATVVSSDDDYSWITYARTVKANWNTICLPFAVSSTDATKFYTIQSLENGVITLQSVAELAAGTPALMNNANIGEIVLGGRGSVAEDVNREIGSNCLVGTYAGTTVPGASDAGHIFYGLSANTGKYVKVSSDVELKPFRAYIECEYSDGNAAGLRAVISDDEPLANAINQLSILSDSETQCYDMNGRKTNGLQKGLNIIKKDGKAVKVMVK